LLAATLKKLAMFVLRAKVKLTSADGELALLGLIGAACDTPHFLAAGACSTGAGGLKEHEFLATLPPADGARRALWIGPAQTASQLVQTPALTQAQLTPELWDWAEVRSGIARITQPVAGALVPQMLNYESVDGINFKKGCYPGQEIVARSQYRGAIKRRAFVGQVLGQAQAGQEVFAAAAPAQPVGLLAQTAPAQGGDTAVIASIQLQARERGNLHIGAPDGPPLVDLHLPYALLEDV
jgi:folate-binding protein YgfZ